MSKIVVMARDPYDPTTWERHEVEGSVCQFLVDDLGAWPETARIYRGQVAQANDITPRCEADIDALDEVEDDVLYVVIYPEGFIFIIFAVIAVVAIVAAVMLLMPKAPTPTIKTGNSQATSPNNELAERTNRPRPGGRIPDIYGEVRSTPDLLASPYKYYTTIDSEHREVEVAYFGIGRGAYDISDVRDDTTPLSEIDGASVEVYAPSTSPNSGTPQLSIGAAITEPLVTTKRLTSVNGQTLSPPGAPPQITVDVKYVYPDTIVARGLYLAGYTWIDLGEFGGYPAPYFDATDLTTIFSPGDVIKVLQTADYTYSGYTINPKSANNTSLADYVIDTVTATEITLLNPSVNVDWADVNSIGGTAPVAGTGNGDTENWDGTAANTWIGGVTLTKDGSGWVGPFLVNLPSMESIYTNFVCSQGLYRDDGTSQSSLSVEVQLEVTPCDASGTPTGSAETFNTTVIGSAVTKNRRAITLRAEPTFTGRCLVRAKRITAKNYASGSIVDEVKWQDVYGVSPVTESHFGNITTAYAVTYGTDGALSVKERKLNMLVTRKLPTRTGTYTFSSGLTATKDAADILCAMALDPYIGGVTLGTLPEAGGSGELDVPQVYDTIDAVKTYFGIDEAAEFCYTFDKSDLSFQESWQLVAQAAFCQAYRRGSVLRLAFEKPQSDSVLLFNHRNKVPRSETRTASFGNQQDYDGVSYQYVDPVDDAIVTIYMPTGIADAIKPMKVESVGVRNDMQANLHAWREWNKIKYQYLSAEFEATQEADVLLRFDRILVADNTRTGSLDGDVVAQSGLELTLSQPVDISTGGPWTCFLQLPTGAVQGITVTSGSAADKVVLATAPATAITVDEMASARATYAITNSANARTATPMLVTEKEPNRGFTVRLRAVNYDVRYYANDLDYA